MYLSAQAVDNTLAFIRDYAARGSRIVFDYIYASVLRQGNRYYGEQDIFETVSKAGEGWTFGLEDGGIKPFLAERGFEIIAHYTPTELEKLCYYSAMSLRGRFCSLSEAISSQQKTASFLAVTSVLGMGEQLQNFT